MITFFYTFYPYFFLVMPINQCLLKCLPCSLLLDINSILFHFVLVQKFSEVFSSILETYAWSSSMVRPYHHFPLNCSLSHFKFVLSIFYSGCRTISSKKISLVNFLQGFFCKPVCHWVPSRWAFSSFEFYLRSANHFLSAQRGIQVQAIQSLACPERQNIVLVDVSQLFCP